jgi:hypothetical protein
VAKLVYHEFGNEEETGDDLAAGRLDIRLSELMDTVEE